MISKEAKQAYDRQRYFNGLRQRIFGRRRCAACTCLLAGRHGAHKTRTYCRSCRDNGAARRHRNGQYYVKNRECILARISRSSL